MMRGFELIEGFDGILPIRGTAKSAGYDFSAISDYEINPAQIVLVKTGIKAYMQDDEVLKIYIRSSLGFKKNVSLANNVGIIDADYYNNSKNEGHIMIALINHSNESVYIKKHERIAQGVFEKYLLADDDQVESIRSGGFGSTS